MSATESAEILGVGIDYITATANIRYGHTNFDSFGRFVVTEQVEKGETLKCWRSSGYRGIAAGSAACGRRSDGACARFSSAVAAEYWEQLFDLSTNVSRLDLQVTIRTEKSAALTLADHWKALRRARRGIGRRAGFKAVLGQNSFETIMLGSRSSDKYGRIYDKGLESGDKLLKDAVRYELELKNEVALNIATQISKQSQPLAFIAAIVDKFITDRNLRLGLDISKLGPATDVLRVPIAREQPATGAYKVIKWASICGKPLIERAKRYGVLPEVLAEMGLSELAPINLSTQKRESDTLSAEEVM